MIEPGNVRDLSYVFANLRDHDRAEVEAQNAVWDPGMVAHILCEQAYAFVCRSEDRLPVVGFGALPTTPVTVGAWLLATRLATPRDLVAVTRFVDGPLRAQLKRDGFRWAEARALADYTEAHGWLARLGGHVIAELPGYGRDGEDFVLFRGQL